jgi:hypothetical protein
MNPVYSSVRIYFRCSETPYLPRPQMDFFIPTPGSGSPSRPAKHIFFRHRRLSLCRQLRQHVGRRIRGGKVRALLAGPRADWLPPSAAPPPSPPCRQQRQSVRKEERGGDICLAGGLGLAPAVGGTYIVSLLSRLIHRPAPASARWCVCLWWGGVGGGGVHHRRGPQFSSGLQS